MKRTTVFADEEVFHVLRQISRQEGVSMAEIIRQALGRFIAAQRRTSHLPSFLGIGRSGQKDVAERCEALLWRTTAPYKKKALG